MLRANDTFLFESKPWVSSSQFGSWHKTVFLLSSRSSTLPPHSRCFPNSPFSSLLGHCTHPSASDLQCQPLSVDISPAVLPHTSHASPVSSQEPLPLFDYSTFPTPVPASIFYSAPLETNPYTRSTTYAEFDPVVNPFGPLAPGNGAANPAAPADLWDDAILAELGAGAMSDPFPPEGSTATRNDPTSHDHFLLDDPHTQLEHQLRWAPLTLTSSEAVNLLDTFIHLGQVPEAVACWTLIRKMTWSMTLSLTDRLLGLCQAKRYYLLYTHIFDALLVDGVQPPPPHLWAGAFQAYVALDKVGAAHSLYNTIYPLLLPIPSSPTASSSSYSTTTTTTTASKSSPSSSTFAINTTSSNHHAATIILTSMARLYARSNHLVLVQKVTKLMNLQGFHASARMWLDLTISFARFNQTWAIEWVQNRIRRSWHHLEPHTRVQLSLALVHSHVRLGSNPGLVIDLWEKTLRDRLTPVEMEACPQAWAVICQATERFELPARTSSEIQAYAAANRLLKDYPELLPDMVFVLLTLLHLHPIPPSQ
ncbi:hypothetical protein H4R33_003512 [Dimargaris cristalligena]|nr:hypothetical protein H4R33_003512 [Dimargaris cristalligena]